MKYLLRIIIIAATAYLFYYLYQQQLGSIPFLLISIFLFYISYKMYQGAAKDQKKK